MPTMRDVPAARGVRHGRRAADPGATQHRRRLVHPGNRRVARRARLDQQHLPHQRRAVRQPHRRLRPRRPAGRVASPSPPSAAASRSPRSSGRAAATPPSTGRPRLPDLPLRPGRRDQLHRRPGDESSTTPLHRLVRAAVRPPRRVRRTGAVPAGRARRRPPAGPTYPRRYSPAQEMRLRVLDFGRRQVRPQRLPLRQHATTAATNYDRVLFSTTKDGDDAVADLRAGRSGPTSRSPSTAARSTARPPGCWSGSRRLTADLSRVRLFHTSVSRAIASWPSWPGEPGYTEFDEFLAAEFPTSTAADFAILEAGITSEETYVEQGSTGRPATGRC